MSLYDPPEHIEEEPADWGLYYDDLSVKAFIDWWRSGFKTAKPRLEDYLDRNILWDNDLDMLYLIWRYVDPENPSTIDPRTLGYTPSTNKL
jgi:hypothetical protein